MRSFLRFAAASLVAFAGVDFSMPTCSAMSLGRAAMPSTVAQYFGYGYGAGHHAPMVRTPGMHPERVPRNLRVARRAGPLYPAAYRPIGCYGDACYERGVAAPPLAPAPEIVTPTPEVVAPPPAAMLGPVPEAKRQVWRRPF